MHPQEAQEATVKPGSERQAAQSVDAPWARAEAEGTSNESLVYLSNSNPRACAGERTLQEDKTKCPAHRRKTVNKRSNPNDGADKRELLDGRRMFIEVVLSADTESEEIVCTGSLPDTEF